MVAFLIAVVMWRARHAEAATEAERDRATLSGMFGRFVPQTIVNAMVAGRGALAPVEREATVLFADIAGFTGMTQRAGAARTVEILNAYFDEVTRIIGAHNGIVTQFQGDARAGDVQRAGRGRRPRAQRLLEHAVAGDGEGEPAPRAGTGDRADRLRRSDRLGDRRVGGGLAEGDLAHLAPHALL